jgi:hypothetical protein
MHKTRNALLVGIDNYPTAPLRGCVDDALKMASLLEKNEDGSKNFSTTLLTNTRSRAVLKSELVRLFWQESDLALLYFSGHGAEDYFGYHIVTPDAVPNDLGIPMSQLLSVVNQSKARNKIIILDCCCAAGMGETRPGSGIAVSVGEGVTVLASCRGNEKSVELNGRGLFTGLMMEALKGAAADTTGNISPGNIYAFIDKALAPGRPRPVFKTNITEFMSLRQVKPLLPAELLKSLFDFFPSADPGYFLNLPGGNSHQVQPAEGLELKDNRFEKDARLSIIRQLQHAGLVEPFYRSCIDRSDAGPSGCRLTTLGLFYRKQIR